MINETCYLIVRCFVFSVPTFKGLPEETLSKIADVLEEVSYWLVSTRPIPHSASDERKIVNTILKNLGGEGFNKPRCPRGAGL